MRRANKANDNDKTKEFLDQIQKAATELKITIKDV